MFKVRRIRLAEYVRLHTVSLQSNACVNSYRQCPTLISHGTSCLCIIQNLILLCCDLYTRFVLTRNVISMIVPLLAVGYDDMRNACCTAMASVFENDKHGSTTLQSVKLIGQFVKSRNFAVRVEVPFLHHLLYHQHCGLIIH